MARCFATLIIEGRMTFAEVSESIKARVEIELKKKGYGLDGKPLQ